MSAQPSGLLLLKKKEPEIDAFFFFFACCVLFYFAPLACVFDLFLFLSKNNTAHC